VPDFLYKPARTDADIPGQISVEFDRSEEALIDEWCQWLADNGWPEPSQFSRYGITLDSFVWSPSDNHMMMHRLRWGGNMAQDSDTKWRRGTIPKTG
jgi:hypothetical protein